MIITTLAAYLHDLDSIIFRVPGLGLPIRWYGMAYLAGFIASFLLIRRLTKVSNIPLPTPKVLDFIVAVAIGMMVGGRLGYILFYDLPLLWTFAKEIPFWSVLAINQGGMASHGGMIGAFAGCVLFAKRNKLPVMSLFDLIALTAPLGIAFGRAANFINCELLGRPVNPDFPLAVKFPQELVDDPELAFQAINAASEAAMQADPTEYPSLLGMIDVESIIMMIQQGVVPIREAVEPILTARHPSQLYALALEGLLVFAVVMFVYRKPQKPGVVTFTFGIVYAIVRIINERWRMPDAHLIENNIMPIITRGQWLSIGMLALAITGLIWSLKRPTTPLGGWLVTNKPSAKANDNSDDKTH